MTSPPPFPSIPYLPGGAAAAGGDRVLPPREAERFLTTPCVVEEKLDGSNVSVTLGGRGQPVCAGRSGPDGLDRAGQYGRLRAWAAERVGPLQALLQGGDVLYGEWLYLRHGVAYDHLPDLLVVLDLWAPDAGFAPVARRDARCAAAGLATVPVLFTGVLGTWDRLGALLRRSRFGSGPAEGLVVRLEGPDGSVERAKWVNPGFVRRSDDAWRGPRELNRVAEPPGAGP